MAQNTHQYCYAIIIYRLIICRLFLYKKTSNKTILVATVKEVICNSANDSINKNHKQITLMTIINDKMTATATVIIYMMD